MKAAFYTFGCKVNQYETQSLIGQFAAAGFSVRPMEENCDVYVVNSCTVTGEGDNKVRKLMRRLRREHPASLLVLCGCYAQAFPDVAALVPEADVITGASNRGALLPAVQRALSTRERIQEIVPHHRGEPFESMQVTHFNERTRAFIKIQDGCDNRCTYCIVWRARGAARSMPPEEVPSPPSARRRGVARTRWCSRASTWGATARATRAGASCGCPPFSTCCSPRRTWAASASPRSSRPTSRPSSAP